MKKQEEFTGLGFSIAVKDGMSLLSGQQQHRRNLSKFKVVNRKQINGRTLQFLTLIISCYIYFTPDKTLYLI